MAPWNIRPVEKFLNWENMRRQSIITAIFKDVRETITNAINNYGTVLKLRKSCGL